MATLPLAWARVPFFWGFTAYAARVQRVAMAAVGAVSGPPAVSNGIGVATEVHCDSAVAPPPTMSLNPGFAPAARLRSTIACTVRVSGVPAVPVTLPVTCTRHCEKGSAFPLKSVAALNAVVNVRLVVTVYGPAVKEPAMQGLTAAGGGA